MEKQGGREHQKKKGGRSGIRRITGVAPQGEMRISECAKAKVSKWRM